MPRLDVLLENIQPGPPAVAGEISLIPLLRSRPAGPFLEYMLAEDALKLDVLRITEVSQSGRVPESGAVNESACPVLLLEGEELVGGKQNRVVNTDVLLRPRSAKPVPVACVERGRWRHDRPDFQPGHYAPPSLRAASSSSVMCSLQESGTWETNQGLVWDEVDGLLAATDADSDTDAMADAFAADRERRGGSVEDLACPGDAVGVVLEVFGQILALDLFDRETTLQRVWPRLMPGYAAAARMVRSSKGPATGAVKTEGLLTHLKAMECKAYAAVDLGEDWRFESAELVGSALVVDGAAIHLSAFPAGRAK